MRESATKAAGRPENGALIQALREKWGIKETDPHAAEVFGQRLEEVTSKREVLEKFGQEMGYGDVEALRGELNQIKVQAEAGKNVAEKHLEKKGFFGRLGEGLKKTGSFVWRNKWWILAGAVAAYFGYGWLKHTLAGYGNLGNADAMHAVTQEALGATRHAAPPIATMPGANFGSGLWGAAAGTMQ